LHKRILALLLGSCASLGFLACGGGRPKNPPSGLTERVFASQGVTSAVSFGGLVIVNGYDDTLPRIAPIPAGSYPGLMAIDPSRSVVAAFDSDTNTIYGVDSLTEKDIGSVKILGPTWSMVVPTAQPLAYAAVPSATVSGYEFTGALEVVNFTPPGSQLAIAVPSAEYVVSDPTGTYFLVFGSGSNTIALINPANAAPPVDTSCITNPGNGVCTMIPGFDRPVFAVISGLTAYVFNCGAECGGTQASIQTLNLSTLAVGAPLPVNGATYGLLNGTSLYVAGLGTPNGPACASLTNSINPTTAATFCGTLDIVNLTTMTDPYYNNPTAEIAIPDGFHDRIDLSDNGQLFVGSEGCTNIGDADNPNGGEVRGCLAIYNTNTNQLTIPPDNGDVGGFQGFTTRYIEYVAEDGNLRVYDTQTDALYINTQYIPQGTILITGYVGDIKAVDFF
jgi:hypothetical protein